MSNDDILENIKSLNVLYVEDDDITRESMHTIISRKVKSFAMAKDGKEGLELFKLNKPDVVITDIRMPFLDGIEMLDEMKKIDKNFQSIITSAFKESDYLLQAISLNINHYIIKPIIKKTLLEALNECAKSINYEKAQNEKIKNYEDTINTFVEIIEQRDSYTAGHTQRVSNYCYLIAKEMKCSNEEINLVQKAGFIHDIGKVAIPDSILLNPNSLNKLEFEIIKEHIDVGYHILSKNPQYSHLAEIVKYHHERYDGNGYPNKISGNDIPKLSRILIVADSFDAMTTNRIYKARMSVSDAIDELKKCSGTQFDPEIVEYAINALKDIKVSENSCQLPKTQLEHRRFAYFFYDQLTGLYNLDYLKFLVNNTKDEYKDYKNLIVFDIHNTSTYNSKFGWNEGDKFLKNFANDLKDDFNTEYIFRVFGDNFVILTKTSQDININDLKINELLSQNDIIKVDTKNINVHDYINSINLF